MQHSNQPQPSHKQLGNQAYRQGQYTQAIQHYQTYIDQGHGDSVTAMSNIALCYYKLRQYTESIRICDEVLQQDETLIKCYYRRAMARKQMLEADPEDGVMRYRICYDARLFRKYCRQGDNAREMEELDKLARDCHDWVVVGRPDRGGFVGGVVEMEREQIRAMGEDWMALRGQGNKQGEREEREEKMRGEINELYREIVKVKGEARGVIKDRIREIRDRYSKEQIKKQEGEETEEPTEQPANKQEKTKGQHNQKTLQPAKNSEAAQKSEQNKEQAQNKQEEKSYKYTHAESAETSGEQQTTPTPPRPADQPPSSAPVPPIAVVPLPCPSLSSQSLPSLHQHFFPDSPSRDIFQQFPLNITALLQCPSLPLPTKQQLLRNLPAWHSDFGLLMRGMGAGRRAQLQTAMRDAGVDEKVVSVFAR